MPTSRRRPRWREISSRRTSYRLGLFLVGALVGSSLLSCGQPVLLVADPYFAAIYLGESETATRLEEAGGASYQIETRTLTDAENMNEELRRLIDNSGQGIVMVSPLMAEEARSIAADYPDRLFVILGAESPEYVPASASDGSGSPSQSSSRRGPVRADRFPANLVVTAFSREQALREAARTVLEAYRPGQGPRAGSDGPGPTNEGAAADGGTAIRPRVAVVYLTDSAKAEAELDTLTAELSAEVPEPEVTVIRYSELPTRDALANRLNALPPGNLDALFSFVGPLNPFVLEQAGGNVAHVVSAEARLFAEGEDRRVYSVERDYSRAITSALALIGRENEALVVHDRQFIEVPAILVTNSFNSPDGGAEKRNSSRG